MAPRSTTYPPTADRGAPELIARLPNGRARITQFGRRASLMSAAIVEDAANKRCSVTLLERPDSYCLGPAPIRLVCHVVEIAPTIREFLTTEIADLRPVRP